MKGKVKMKKWRKNLWKRDKTEKKDFTQTEYKKSHKVLFCIILTMTIFLLTGCERAVSIEEKEYVLVLGIDKDKSGKKAWEVYYSKADTSKLQGEAGKIAESTHVSYKVDTLAQSELEDRNDDAKQLSLGHLKAIFIGEKLAKDEREWKRLIEELEKTNEISKTVLVYICSPDAKSLIETDKDISGTLGEYMEQLSNKQERQTREKSVTLNDVIVELNGIAEGDFIPVLKVKEKRPSLVKQE
ncbi:MAG: hypothetical protein ACI4F9_09650 [Lachnospiraceae bacterium]